VTLVHALRSILAYILIVVFVLIVGPIGVFVGAVLRWKRGMYALGHLGVGLALALTGIRFRVAGRENVPSGTAVVFCSNHESNVDPLVLFRGLHRQLHILYKAELRKLPVLKTVFDVGGFVAVDRGDRERSMRSLEKGAESLRAGHSFLIFPEGTRSRTGAMLPFKKGGFIMAIKAQVPMVPVAVLGGRNAMRKGSAFVRPVRVGVRIGRPVPTAGLTLDDRDELVARVRAEVQKLLDEGPVWT
jgi:1-acyl-sn-glycerol-3-phosphate acyltransferase